MAVASLTVESAKPMRKTSRRWPLGVARADACCFAFTKTAACARDDDDMTSLRFDDGGCAAMTPARCEAFRASLMSFRHFVISSSKPRSGEVICHLSFVICLNAKRYQARAINALRTRSKVFQNAASCVVAKLMRISGLGCRLAWNSAPGASR